MQETPQQYIQRILGYIGKRNPLTIQRATPRRIERLLRGLGRRQMMARPAPGKWSIAEILAHLAEAELVGGYRVRMILGKNGTSIQAFDEKVWARNANYARQDPRKSLALFRMLRESNLLLLKSLSRRKWNYYGVHEERGKETVARVAQMFAGHDSNHILQIKRIAQQFRRS